MTKVVKYIIRVGNTMKKKIFRHRSKMSNTSRSYFFTTENADDHRDFSYVLKNLWQRSSPFFLCQHFALTVREVGIEKMEPSFAIDLQGVCSCHKSSWRSRRRHSIPFADALRQVDHHTLKPPLQVLPKAAAQPETCLLQGHQRITECLPFSAFRAS